MNKIPIIILNYNSSSDCRKCISFLKKQEGIELEFVVVDNCSPREGEQEAIRHLCADNACTFIQATENKGYNAGNNIGLRYASSKGYEYALIANPDMEFPQTDYAKKLVEAINEKKDVVVCGSDIIGLDGIHQSPMVRDGNWMSYWEWIAGLFKNKKEKSQGYLDTYMENHYCQKVSGCCLLLRLSFMETIGFFDEYPFLYCEEGILSRQVEMAGKRMYYLADVQAIHAHVKSAKGKVSARLKHWKRSRLYFIKKYSGDTFCGKVMSYAFVNLYMAIINALSYLEKYRKRH